MELTRERVEEILKRIEDSFIGKRISSRGPKIEVIVALREGFCFGLKEGKDYAEAHWDDLDFIRKDLEEHAGLAPEMKSRFFETWLFRLEVKRMDITQEQLHEFFSKVALECCNTQLGIDKK
ncbi:MAG: hypothetical protein HYV51_02990 [Parcubacteria group bacterium]|nr:hypothetical protein [Parcubacteria group bacterium]